MLKRVFVSRKLLCSVNNSLTECSLCSITAVFKSVWSVGLSNVKPITNVRLCVTMPVGRTPKEQPRPSPTQFVNSAQANNDSRLIKVAIVGVPNAGKSTVINQLVGQQVCSASSKVHTTRFRVRAVVNEGNAQIVLLDTPGLVGTKQAEMHHLERSFLVDGNAAAREADVICVVHDASNKWTREKLDEGVLVMLKKFKDKRSLLVLNKVDLLRSKRVLLDLVNVLKSEASHNSKGWPHFEQIFMTSALTGSGIPELKEYLLDISSPGPWLFEPDVTTDQSKESLIEDAVRAALLNNLPQEIPYQIKPEVEHLHLSPDGKITAVVLVACSVKRFERMIVGAKAWRIRKIAQEAEQQLQSAFNTTVTLNLVISETKKN